MYVSVWWRRGRDVSPSEGRHVCVWWRRGRAVSPSEGRHVCECVVEMDRAVSPSEGRHVCECMVETGPRRHRPAPPITQSFTLGRGGTRPALLPSARRPTVLAAGPPATPANIPTGWWGTEHRIEPMHGVQKRGEEALAKMNMHNCTGDRPVSIGVPDAPKVF